MKIIYKKVPLTFVLIMASCMSFAQMNYTNLEWVDRTPIVGNSIFHTSSVIHAGKLVVTGNILNSNGDTDVMTIMYDTNGDTLWMSTFNGSANGDDYGVELKVDAGGNVYVAAAVKNTSTGYDMGVLKYNSSGSLTWSYSWNGAGNGDDIPTMITIDAIGAISSYVVGLSEASNGLSDYGMIKVSNTGSLTWSQYYDYNNLHDGATGISGGGPFTINVAGVSAATLGDWDIATVTLSKSTGSISATNRTNVTGATMEEAFAMTTDSLNNVYITGYALSGDKNIQTIKLDSNLALVWIVNFEGDYDDVGRDIAVDDAGNVYVTGYTELQNGGTNFITIKYNSSGTEQWVRQLGNAGEEEIAIAEKMAVTPNGDIYLTGTSTINNQSKMMFVKYDDQGSLKLASEYESDTVDYEAYDINLSGDDVYITGLEKTIDTTRLTVLKYAVSERIIQPVLENSIESYVEGELIIQFRPVDLIVANINSKDIMFGDLSDFIVSDIVDSLDTYCPGLDWARVKTYKIFQGMTTNDTLSVTPTGHETEMYPFFAYLLIQIDEHEEEYVIDSLRKYLIPYVQSVHVNPLFSPLTDDPEYGSQNSLYPNSYPNGDINMETAWTIETGKSNIKVGVYDTGIMYTHTDLGGSMGTTKKIKGGKDYYTGSSLNTVSNNGDAHGHGTKVAGIIGAYTNNDEGIAGIGGGNWPYDNTVVTPNNPTTENQGISLYGFKLIGETPVMPMDKTTQALLEGSANTTGGYGYGLHVMNCSFQKNVSVSLPAGDYHDTLDLMYNVQRQIFRNGTVLVAGQGNDNEINYKTPAYSTKEFWVLSVGGSDTAGVRHPNSNYGLKTDIIAPYSSELVYTTSNTGNDDYASFSGTSASAPHVTGVVGLMLSHINDMVPTGNLRPDDVQFLLKRYALDVVDAGDGAGSGWDQKTGAGLLDAGNVMTNINRDEYVIRHYYVDTTFIQVNAVNMCGGGSPCFMFNFQDATHEYGTYSAHLYFITINHAHNLNPGDVVLNYWPLNSYTNLTIPNYGGLHLGQHENEMQIGSIIDFNAPLNGYTMLITSGPNGDIPDFWYPVAPGDPVKLGYALHIQSDYAGTDEEVLGKFQWSCYPNPTNRDYTISFVLEAEASVAIEITDVNGRVVYSVAQKSYSIGQQFVNFNVNNLSNGVYLVKLRVDDESYYEKFIKQ